MSGTAVSLADVQKRLAALGLDAGALTVTDEVEAPPGTGTLVLAVASRDRMWQVFRGSPEFSDKLPSPLDRWSRRVIDSVADDLGAEPIYPFGGPPYWPFLSWARHAGDLWQSPIGLSVHDEFGLWYSCRGALAFRENLDLPLPKYYESPCLSCSGRPCTQACPVDAFQSGAYDVDRCAKHLATAEGAECLNRGCLARRACPVGTAYTHTPERAKFHMHAFLHARPKAPGEPAA